MNQHLSLYRIFYVTALTGKPEQLRGLEFLPVQMVPLFAHSFYQRHLDAAGAAARLSRSAQGNRF